MVVFMAFKSTKTGTMGHRAQAGLHWGSSGRCSTPLAAVWVTSIMIIHHIYIYCNIYMYVSGAM